MEERRIKPDPNLRARLAAEYKEAKRFAEATTARADELKKVLVNDVKEHGVPDDKGHLWAPAGDYQLKYEKRVSNGFDVRAAEEWAKANGLWDQVKEVVETVSEEKCLALAWSDPEAGESIRGFYTQKESWAFKLVEQKAYGDDD